MDNLSDTSSTESVPSSDLCSLSELLRIDGDQDGLHDIIATPIFSESVRKYAEDSKQHRLGQEGIFTQYGLLALNISQHGPGATSMTDAATNRDRRVFFNVAAPTSMFICGSQGSGKSHTLGTVLENCLVSCTANLLPRPLTGLVFHYDTFISDTGGLPCEAAYLSSHSAVKVRVLCPPTNVGEIKRIYSCLPNVLVEELRIDQSELNTKRMLDLMAVSSIQGGGMPLYLHVVTRVLREMRIRQQQTESPFDYKAFKLALSGEALTDGQFLPLQQRLETLESFMVQRQAAPDKSLKSKSKPRQGESCRMPEKGNDWTPVAGQLTVVDLSCPCVTAEMACSLFNICLSLFLEKDTRRHLGVRVIISTQEPSISPKLLDLCSVAVVHRFTSPDWLRSLQRHLAGISVGQDAADAHQDRYSTSLITTGMTGKQNEAFPVSSLSSVEDLFSRIVALRTGEAFIFAPSATIGILQGSAALCSGKVSGHYSKVQGATTNTSFLHLGSGAIQVRLRRRITADGGKSVMAT
ncbi:hypothetical protein HIM_12123 [Hirsutella minnesotensis 3608]|uniref:Uncharacterized protein n=1 Tax=Hirsutella minnesotensis 3608 TaxID=1043627 RepID=A0A0F7ZQU8_9HYPO|nr:hypothetical protein HIM_12123 [Hirsutella minnesotensis 3608]